MSMIFRRLERVEQPPYPVAPQRNVLYAWTASGADVVRPATTGAGPVPNAANRFGLGANLSAANSAFLGSALGTTGATMVVVMTRTGATQASGIGYSAAGGVDRFSVHLPYSDNTVYFDYGGTAGSNRVTISGLSNWDGTWVFTAGPLGLRIFFNGRLLASSSGGVTRAAGSNAFGLGQFFGIDTGAIYNALIVDNVQWPDAEALAVSANPWSAFEPQTIRIPQGIAASGSPYTLTAAAGSYTLTGGAATLKVGRVVTAAAGSYTLTGGAATLAVGHKLTAAAGSFALTGNAATLTRGYRVASSQGGVVVYVNNNLFSASEAFNSSPWNRLNGAVTDDATASPTGSLNADKFAASGTAIPYLEQPFSISAGTTYTVSAYIKANEITSALFVLYGTHWNNGGSNLSATFNLSTGAVTSSTVSSSGATNAGGGWWRCWVTHTATANLSTAGLQLARFSGASTTTGHSLYVWGAQANVGALTDYVQTGQQANLRYSRVLDAVAGSFSLYVAQATLRYSGAPEVETPLAPAGKSKRKDKRRRVEIDGHIYDVPERDLPTLLEAVLTRRKPPKTAIVEPVEREDEDEEGEAEEGVLHETLEAAWEAPSLDEVQARYDAIYAQISAQATADVANMLRRVTERLMAEIEDEEDAIMALVA